MTIGNRSKFTDALAIKINSLKKALPRTENISITPENKSLFQFLFRYFLTLSGLEFK